MIRPILYVNLPAVVYALDRAARSRRGEFATFICAPDAEDSRGGLTPLLNALVLINPNTLTWICEDRWRLLGLAQARRRPAAAAWDLNYLATIIPATGQSRGQFTSANGVTGGQGSGSGAGNPPDEVVLELLQYALDAALMRGVQRVFARVDDASPALELFVKTGFQRYARELTYWRAHSPSLAELDAADARDQGEAPTGQTTPHTFTADHGSLRTWHRHDAWGLLRLGDASTPRRVQLAECLNSEEFAHTAAVGGRMWSLPGIEPEVRTYVVDHGVRLGGWLRLRYGRGTQPHQLWLMAHPEEASLAGPLLRFGLRQFAGAQAKPIVCQVREYDGVVIDALRGAGFEHGSTRALLVRHLLLRALRQQAVPAMEARVAYGAHGLGTAPSRLGNSSLSRHDRSRAGD
jgi:hypothetical protein